MAGITEFLKSNPDLRMAIFAGKGGLGKTTCSASLALSVAATGKKVLCFSTDPQASLSDIYERDIFGKGEVNIAPGLFVVEIDADSKISTYVQDIKLRIKEMYKLDEIPPEIESYIDSSVAEPAMYESATYDAMAEYLSQGKYDFYIFDMPPFGHGIRMVSMAEILSAWVSKLTEARQMAREYEEMASRLRGQKLVKEDEVLRELHDIQTRLTTFTDVMKDSRRAAFFMVMTPERMSILDTEKALDMFTSMGMHLSGIILNKVLPSELDSNPSPFIINRLKQQREALAEVKEKFGKSVVASIPLFAGEPKGQDGLQKVSEFLMGGNMRPW